MKYVSIPKRKNAPRADYYPADVLYGELLHLPRLSVSEDDDPKETGLLDARGNPLYRVKERGKLGF